MTPLNSIPAKNNSFMKYFHSREGEAVYNGGMIRLIEVAHYGMTYEPNYRVALGKPHYTYVHSIYCKQCSFNGLSWYQTTYPCS
jgi:hypothetical protein